MTLRTDYFDGSTGLDAQILAAEVAGAAFVVTNRTIISTAMVVAAGQGKKTFVVTIATTFNPTALRLKGLMLNAYLAGVIDGLLTEGIYSFECVPTLNISDSLTTSIDFNFAF